MISGLVLSCVKSTNVPHLKMVSFSLPLLLDAVIYKMPYCNLK